MRTGVLFAFVVLSVGVLSQTDIDPTPIPDPPPAPFPAYNYMSGARGPANWAKLDSRYSDCRLTQSPVSIRQSYRDKSLEHLQFNYVESEIDLEVRDGTYRWLFDEGNQNTLVAGGVQYRLREIVVHTPSEHLVRGIQFPLELQFMHESILPEGVDDATAKKLYRIAAVSVLGVSGSSDHSGVDLFMRGMRTDVDVDMWKKGYNATEGPLDMVFDQAPVSTMIGWKSAFSFGKKEERRQTGVRLNPAALLPDRRPYYTYTGQLTAPPCTTQVQWYVLQEQIQLKTTHVDRFYFETGPNARLVDVTAKDLRIARYDEPEDAKVKELVMKEEDLTVPGPRGDRGANGVKGEVGLPGNIGQRGVRGEPGKDAVDGKNGPRGPAGPQGKPGRKGSRGPIGRGGAKGEAGPVGPRGAAGRDGADGRSIPGPQGPQGPPGLSIVGDEGPQGPEGDEGVAGPKGETGPKGKRGPKGASVGGEQGDRGDKGPDGEEGPQGAQGPRGDSGKAGAKGLVGPRGRRGPQGPAGEEGPVTADVWQPFSLLAQVEAQSFCVSQVMRSGKGGWAFAVGRDTEGGRTCEEICEVLTTHTYKDAAALTCIHSFTLTNDAGATGFNKPGLGFISFPSCKSHKNGGGPNYCCCRNED